MIETKLITIRGIDVQIERKPIKNLHLGVYPPNGRVRVAVPEHLTDENVRLAVVNKLRWIKRQRASFENQPRQSQREMVSGESHYLWGQRYLLEVVERRGKHTIVPKPNSKLILCVNPGTTRANREQVLTEHYRAEIKQRIPTLLNKWESKIGVQVNDWGVKKMKTKWGSCMIESKRIWLNLEMAKKRPECLEYILVHELIHLLERHHNDNFRTYMDRFLPTWQNARDILNTAPLGHEEWGY